MLTLSQSRRFGSFTVFRDVTYQTGKPVYGPVFYVLPDAPRIAQDTDGNPAFDFLWFRGAAGESSVKAGGIVTLTVDFSLTQEEQETLPAELAAAYGLGAVARVELRSMPFKSGMVKLTYAAESGGGEFSHTIAGSGPARLAGSQRATFVADLNADGAALLWDALEKQIDLFRVQFDFAFDHRMADTRMRIWCDAKKSHEVLGTRIGLGVVDPAKLRQTLTEQRLAGIQIDSEQPLTAEHQEALEKAGHELLDSALASTFFQPQGTDKDLSKSQPLRPFTVSMEAALNMTFSESFPLEHNAVVESVLRLGRTRQEMGDRIRRLELDGGFFRILEVPIHCTVDFGRDLISMVKVTVEYNGTSSTGTIHRKGEFVFQEGVNLQTFRTDLASPDQTQYVYSVDVHYRGHPTPLHLASPPTNAGAIVLDLDGLGILSVKAELRDVPLNLVKAAVVDFEYAPQSLSHRMILDGERLADEWQAVTQAPIGPYRYKVDWALGDGRRIEGDWQESSRKLIHLDAPAQVIQKARVLVVAAGNFTALAQIIVDLQSRASPEVSKQLSFTRAGETQIWEPPNSPQTEFEYQYRRTLAYQDGSIRRLDPDWRTDTSPVLIVRDELRFEVQVVPRLLDLGGSLRFALLDLEYQDEIAGRQEHETFVLRTKEDQPQWAFQLGDPERRTYRYRVTLFTSQGERQPAWEWRLAADEILVLRPPQPSSSS
jgi:hypothetical protein